MADFQIQYRDRITGKAGLFSVLARDYYEIYSYLGGDGPFFYFIDKTLFELRPGDVLLIRPHILHGGCKKERARYCRLYVRFPSHMLDFLASLDPDLYDFLQNGPDRIRLTGEDAAAYRELLAELKELQSSQSRHRYTLWLSCLLRQLTLLCRAARQEAELPSTPEDPLLSQIVGLVNSKYASLSTVGDIAGRLNYSPNYLAHYFFTHMGIRLHDYLITKKLSVAAARLAAGMSVTDCGIECGFGSTAYFIQLFKAHFHITPGQYAAQYR